MKFSHSGLLLWTQAWQVGWWLQYSRKATWQDWFAGLVQGNLIYSFDTALAIDFTRFNILYYSNMRCRFRNYELLYPILDFWKVMHLVSWEWVLVVQSSCASWCFLGLLCIMLLHRVSAEVDPWVLLHRRSALFCLFVCLLWLSIHFQISFV